MIKNTLKQRNTTRWPVLLLLSLLFFGCSGDSGLEDTSGTIIGRLDVAPVWSVHRTGPPELLTRDGLQYVAYYDHDRFLTLAQRQLDSNQWKSHRFPVQMDWQTGAHAKLSLALDRHGYIHITCYRRRLQQEPPMPPRPIYYRSLAPHSIDGFERLYMVSENERTDYPTFTTVDGNLFFSFRDGGSGRGDQYFYHYDDERRQWEQVLDTPLLDGRGEMSAYAIGGGLPVSGPDGRWHLLWMWRDTPDHATNHSLSYARTVGSDLGRWESAAGVPVTPPFTIYHTELLVDAAPPGGGLSNPLQAMSFDSRNRVVISYHRFDETGASQIYNARFDGESSGRIDQENNARFDDSNNGRINNHKKERMDSGKWTVVPATRWDFVWGESYSGTGALNIFGTVRMSGVTPSGNGELIQTVWNREEEEALVVLDEESLQPIRLESPRPSGWRQQLLYPESGFQVEPIPDLRRAGGPMQVELIPDSHGMDEDGVSWFLRWEHGGANRDRPVPEPWPEPAMLRVYKISNAD